MPNVEVELGGQIYNVNVPDGEDVPAYLAKYKDNMQGRVDTSDLIPSARVAGKMALQAQPIVGSLVPNDPEMAAYYSKHPTAANLFKGAASIPAWTALMAVAPEVGLGRAATLGLQALTGGGVTAADIEARNATGQEERPDAGGYAARVGLGTAAPVVGSAIGKLLSPGSKWAQAELDAADPMRIMREQLAKGPQGTPLPQPSLPGRGGEWLNPTPPSVPVPFRNMIKPTPANTNIPDAANTNSVLRVLGARPGQQVMPGDIPPPANLNDAYTNAVTRADLDAIGRAVPAAERATTQAAPVAGTGKPVFTGQGTMDWFNGVGKAAGVGALIDVANYAAGQMFHPGLATTLAVTGRALGPSVARGAAKVGNFLVDQPPVQKYLANNLFSQPGTLLNSAMLAAPEGMYQNYNEEGGSPVFTSPVTGR